MGGRKSIRNVVADWGLTIQFDALAAAESSRFNVHKSDSKSGARPANGNGAAGAAGKNGARQAAQKPAFRTLADLGSE